MSAQDQREDGPDEARADRWANGGDRRLSQGEGQSGRLVPVDRMQMTADRREANGVGLGEAEKELPDRPGVPAVRR